MANNVSRFLQLDSTILLEYIINDNDILSDNINSNIYEISDFNPTIYEIKTDYNKSEKLYIQLDDKHDTNNSLNHTVVPIDNVNGRWFIPNDTKYITKYCNDLSDTIKTPSLNVPFDTIKLHIINGYSFKDIYGILIQVKVKNNNNEYSRFANWLYRRSDINYVYERAIILESKIYDKYLELKIPSYKFLSSVQNLSDNNLSLLGETGLDIANSKNINNIEITYSIISNDTIEYVYNDDFNKSHIGYSFLLDNQIKVEIPYNSEADRFNSYIAESNSGNYIDFCGTWDNKPITKNTVDAFNTRIKLYTANNYNTDEYYNDMGAESQNKWVINHEIITYFYKDNKWILMPQYYNIQQTFTDNEVNRQNVFNFKPIINNNLDANNIDYITIEYTARLINRYDGTQIVRKSALTTYNIYRYVENIVKLNTKTISNYKVYNKILNNNTELKTNGVTNTKYIKIYYNASDIVLDNNGVTNIIENYTQNISKYGGTYLFTFKNKDNSAIDFTDMTSYVLKFTEDSGATTEINATYSNNMNMVLGQLEFYISPTNAEKMKKITDKKMAILSKNIDGSSSVIAEIKYNI